MAPPIRVAALLRVSTTSIEQEESPAAQLSYIREEIRRHQGAGDIWIDSGYVYEDELTGALVLERPSVKRLLADAAAGKFELVAMKAISRLGRDTLGLLSLKRRLWDDMGIDLASLQDGYRAARDPELIFLIHADRAQHGRTEISRNVRTAMRQKALQGLWTCGKIPFGYQRVGRNEIAPHPATTPVVQEVFRLRAEGWGLSAITAHLNNTLQVPAPQWWYRWGLRQQRLTDLAQNDDRWRDRLEALRQRYEGCRPEWRNSTIKVLLRNTAYCGELQYYRTYHRRSAGGQQKLVQRPVTEHIALPCPPLVDRDLWQRVQEMCRRRLARGKPRHGRYLLSGLAYCQCGSRLNGGRVAASGRPEYVYYICHRRRESGTCQAPAIPAEQLESAVISRVRQGLQPLAATPPAYHASPAARPKAQLMQLERALAELKDKRRYYHDQHRLGRVTDEQLDEELADIKTREHDALRAVERLRAETMQHVTGREGYRRVMELWHQYKKLETSDPHVLRQLLMAAVDRVVVTSPYPAQTAVAQPHAAWSSPERPAPVPAQGPDPPFPARRKVIWPPDLMLRRMMSDPDATDGYVASLVGCSDSLVWKKRKHLGIGCIGSRRPQAATRAAYLARWEPVLAAWRAGVPPENALAQLATQPGPALPEREVIIWTRFPIG